MDPKPGERDADDRIVNILVDEDFYFDDPEEGDDTLEDEMLEEGGF
jgi:hypothetical protein